MASNTPSNCSSSMTESRVLRPHVGFPFNSELGLREIGEKISARLFAGIPFEEPTNLFDTMGIRLSAEILGCAVYLTELDHEQWKYAFRIKREGTVGDEPVVDVRAGRSIEEFLQLPYEERFPDRANLSDYVRVLLSEIPEISFDAS